MWKKSGNTVVRLNPLATASSLGVLLMLVQGMSVAAQDPTLATVVVQGPGASEAQKAEKQLKKVAGLQGQHIFRVGGPALLYDAVIHHRGITGDFL